MWEKFNVAYKPVLIVSDLQLISPYCSIVSCCDFSKKYTCTIKITLNIGVYYYSVDATLV
jgi:hypothetical protein